METVKQTLSPKDLAAAVGVSESSLKRWADDGSILVTRTEGGHRRIAVGEAIRFIRESKLQLVRPGVLGLGGFLQPSTEVRSAMDTLGELWRERPEGIFLEHRATDICLQALDQLRVLQPVPNDAPVLVGAAPEGDPYLLPSLMAAASLSLEGFRAINLGPQTPSDTVVHAVDAYRTSVVWISLTSSQLTRAQLEQYVKALLPPLTKRKASLIVGGRAATRVRHLRDPILHFGSSMAELVAFARGRLG